MTTFKEAQRIRSKPVARSSVPLKHRQGVSKGEAMLCRQLDVMKIAYEQEFRFHPERRWKADFRIEGYMILVEVEGGAFSNGRHTRGEGYIGDMEKYNSAAMMGFTVLRFSTEQVKAGVAIKQIEQLVG
ncbi:DUF559 domain-containing protein [Acinetobacter baumannii]|uniref:DUF559 domain-containing protein n=1 Tax=Acinetobacter baumannii TaxID=470 RepID=UPI000D656196|nr:DUF559 domain-containing protein [Acinetobacter baumannii]MCT9272902.1 endonuclease domain-containing protein [Acinetobacter baumannii]MCW8773158.1 endonuclease domain-containing protein [Acinetobacter baumannii]MDA3560524.1 endonuclease domain-containing protein [Acinetobacter baumannii]MDA3573975.1 endonuclease domain-containing protein [Acinetobacter baumannii]MDN8251913.1 DUF559 domain-containing protein [Acinetobacter baumannii]